MARPGKLPKTVWQLGWISFFADVASEMAYPILPLFLRSIGAPATALGAIEGMAEALVSFMKGASGLHSDRTGKRVPYVQSGYGLSALGKPLLSLAYAWPTVLGARLLDRLGKGLRTTARDALIADSVEPAQLGRAFGFHRGLDTAGALVGVAVTLLLLQFLPGEYRLIFALALVPGLLSVALAFRVREAPAQEGEGAPPRPDWRELPGSYWRVLGIATLFALANSSDTFLLLRARDAGLSDAGVVAAYALYNITYMILSYPAGVWSDRIGRWAILIAGWVIYAGVYFGFARLSGSTLWPLFALYGVYMGFTQGVSKALVADHAPKYAKGTALGIFYMVSGFAVLMASLIAGLLWDRYGPSATFTFGGSAALVAVSAAVLFAPRRSAPSRA